MKFHIKMPKLYTKMGDGGITRLFDGKKVKKSNQRIKLLSELDHFISVYGSEFPDDIEIITALMDICTIVANPSKNYIFDEDEILIKMIENKTDDLMNTLPKLTNFILPDNHLHIIRTTCRKLECDIVILNNNNVTRFINRLSSLLFAKAYSKSKKIPYTRTYIRQIEIPSNKKNHYILISITVVILCLLIEFLRGKLI